VQKALFSATLAALAILPALTISPTQEAKAEEVTVLFGKADIPTTTIQEPPPVQIPADVPIAAPPSLEEISTYIMRTLPPEELIRYMWRDTPHVNLMLRIAAREACLYCKHRDGTPYTPAEICSADNPRSSAAGLFQTMGFHRALAEGMGLSWSNVAGPDCWDDARLAFQLYNHGKGLSNWNPLP
jgi:hypothetical protein